MTAETRLLARRALVLAGLLALTLAVSACGSASKSAQRPGRVRVNFCTTVSMPECKRDATVAQEAAVGRMLRRIPDVTKVVFIPKKEALWRTHLLNPTIPVSQLPTNPLPDEWVVTLTSEEDNAKVGKAICASRYAGVQPCRGLPGSSGATWDTLTPRIRARLG